MAPFSSISPFSFSSFSFFSFPLPDRAFPLRGKKKKERKSAAGVASTRSFPSLHGFPRPHVLCSWRTAVGSIYSGDHPPPSHVDHGLEGAGRSVSPRKPWEARQEKGYSPPPLPPPPPPPFRRPLRSQDLGISTGSMHSWTGRMGLGGGCDWSRGRGRVGGSVWMETRRKD